jgi:hypothetical protein
MHTISLASSSRPARNAMLSAALVCLLGLMARAANADKPQPSDDPIVVPQAAVEVDHINLFGGNRKWTPLNHRMILATVGTKYFLMVFDETCPRLMQRNAIITTLTNDTVLDARTDVIYVDTRVSGSSTADALAGAREGAGFPCQIDRMYSILDEDAKALREQFKR